jgi:pheromone shutdown protein TraB
MNSKEYQKQDYDAQWKIWLNTNFPSGSDRARYALWEMRNLQISANIMKTAAFYPGKKILVIIGASHKSFIEKYLQQANNIRLLDFN